MEVQILTLCDNAQEYNGKLVLVGAFNQINAPSYPTKIPEMSIVAHLSFAEEDNGEHTITFGMTNEATGMEIIKSNPYKPNIDIQSKNHTANVNLVVKAPNFIVPNEGRYILYVDVDGHRIQSTVYAGVIKPKQQQ